MQSQSKQQTYVINSSDDTIISVIKENHPSNHKPRLYLDVDGTLVAMIFNTKWGPDSIWNAINRTDFCHWINSIHAILDEYCEVFVLTNFTAESEKLAKENWLSENLKCKYVLILNKEGVSKAIHVDGERNILVDDTFRNLLEWEKAGGTQFAYQWVTCEKGRRQLLDTIVDFSIASKPESNK